MRKKFIRNGPAAPTQAELDILNVLWARETATVREVYDEVREVRGGGYTTVLKLMQIMTEKGLVTRDTSSRSHLYRAAVSQQSTQRGLIGDLLNRAFEGSLHQLVLRAIEEEAVPPEELRAIRGLLDERNKK